VTSTVVRARATAASEADRVGTSAPPTTGGEGGDLCTSGLQPAPVLQAAMEGGYKVRGRPRPAPVCQHPVGGGGCCRPSRPGRVQGGIATIGRVLSVRAFVDLPRFLLRVFECHEV
jgi:hypothetical protein